MVFEWLKENPIKIATSVIGLLVAVAGTILAIDARYAHASDVIELKQQLIANDLRSDIRSLKSRKLIVEDKIIELTPKIESKKNTDADRLIYERYKNELTDINEELRRKANALQNVELEEVKK